MTPSVEGCTGRSRPGHCYSCYLALPLCNLGIRVGRVARNIRRSSSQDCWLSVHATLENKFGPNAPHLIQPVHLIQLVQLIYNGSILYNQSTLYNSSTLHNRFTLYVQPVHLIRSNTKDLSDDKPYNTPIQYTMGPFDTIGPSSAVILPICGQSIL